MRQGDGWWGSRATAASSGTGKCGAARSRNTLRQSTVHPTRWARFPMLRNRQLAGALNFADCNSPDPFYLQRDLQRDGG